MNISRRAAPPAPFNSAAAAAATAHPGRYDRAASGQSTCCPSGRSVRRTRRIRPAASGEFRRRRRRITPSGVCASSASVLLTGRANVQRRTIGGTVSLYAYDVLRTLSSAELPDFIRDERAQCNSSALRKTWTNIVGQSVSSELGQLIQAVGGRAAATICPRPSPPPWAPKGLTPPSRR